MLIKFDISNYVYINVNTSIMICFTCWHTDIYLKWHVIRHITVQRFHLRAIPDKNQKILNGAGHSWSQIFMKLSEHVKVVTLSKYLTLFFSQHARLPWQPDTKILAFRSAK